MLFALLAHGVSPVRSSPDSWEPQWELIRIDMPHFLSPLLSIVQQFLSTALDMIVVRLCTT